MSLTMVAERPAQARGAEEASEPFGVAGIEVSVVMPCLNEAEAIAYCIQKALKAFVDMDARGEVVVVDNGSTDRSTEIATAMGARVVSEPDRGYGNAYRAGIRAARGRYIIMGDSDGTYDFGDIPLFVEPLLNGTDVVIGSRLRGTIEPGAMPWLHRYIGNPLLTGFLNVLFAAGVSDAHCGMRSFRRQALGQLSLSAPGMEFASELIIETVRNGLRLKEIPIYYARRAGGAPKLRTWRDGTRHLWLMLTKAFSDPLDRNADPRLSQASKTDRADRTHH